MFSVFFIAQKSSYKCEKNNRKCRKKIKSEETNKWKFERRKGKGQRRTFYILSVCMRFMWTAYVIFIWLCSPKAPGPPLFLKSLLWLSCTLKSVSLPTRQIWCTDCEENILKLHHYHNNLHDTTAIVFNGGKCAGDINFYMAPWL